jgi:hypothetical protein
MDIRLEAIGYSAPDWQQMIADIRRCGFTTTEIGDALGIHQSHVSRLARGLQRAPTHEVGCKIIELHEREMQRFAKRIARWEKSNKLNASV